ncbi:transcriptional regulator, TetR family (plasmid) [Novosphingobium aromaticivorans DSM 12444]|uniref:Transcriptional regulator, TetR family n=1 Tax=Novosphingobium aromaticivorans (strain ATCC 700278 / DSM 12444 / CCUG 56034 / CIP 105152 / NBRC 16084 / F199) TaxID=279238 RepID=A4XEZ2_NOVAD|nr:TetR/AcrR family transcriptional regulator [Novosphingobium aromaticivorans]ABP64503.1 transcriptional regulator, TetR family [Novosphingobium aromaticivorans DSM 12444]SCY92856.1 transcriptional regulator, TetR family [Novosphingobium aromaticivorans]
MKADANSTSGSGRRGRPSAESTRLRMAHLLEVARGIFVRRGYRATTMDEVAAAAGVTKRTLYAWHSDKEALFRACVMLGAERFPRIEPQAGEDARAALERYVLELHRELTCEDSYGMGALFLREAAEFPELAGSIQRGHFDFMVEPLAAYLRGQGLEEEASTERTMLFVAMALSPLHNAMLVGMALPGTAGVAAHARRCVSIFLDGSRLR